MKQAIPLLLFAAFLASAPLGTSNGATGSLVACARIASDSGRLACFDRLVANASGQGKASPGAASVSNTILAVAANEHGRAADDMRFRMTKPASVEQGSRVLISAVARNAPRPRPLMVIACVDSITRLQLVVDPPVAPVLAHVSLLSNGKPLEAPRSWQVLEGGRVVDAGRGLPAIELLRRMTEGGELHVSSDLPAIDGLRFDTTGLPDLIAVQRKACHW